MVSDELCNTALDLGLGLLSSSSDDSSNKLTRKPSTPQNLDTIREPSLNLSLSGETHNHFLHSDGRHIKFNYIKDHSRTVDHLSRQDSGGVASSFSNNLISVKRERLDPHHVVEIEKVLSKASDEDDDHDGGINGRKKLRLTKSQSALLEESFKLHSTLSPNQKHELARELKLRTRQVEVWFQNRRARSKLKQTEADCELLKKCCENLTEENRRLHRELQHLKTLKLPHHYIQFPTLLCPSCDKNINWLS